MNTELEKVEVAGAVSPLVTLDPETYVAAVYAPFNTRLEAAIQKVEGVTYDITTTAGMDTAKECRALFRAIRIESDKERATRKAPIISIGKLLDSKNAEIEKAVDPFESKFDADIKAEEKRKDDEKAARIKAEAERQSALDAKIKHITEAPLRAISMSASDTRAVIEELQQIVPTPETYEERFVEAEVALNAAITALESLHQGKVAIEQQQAEAVERERQALAQQNEQARIDGIKARITAIKNHVLDASSCEHSAEMEIIIAKVNAIVVDESYAEFNAEAEEAKAATLTNLTRQLKFIKMEEEAKAKAAADEAARKAAAELAAKQVVESAATQSEPALAEAAKQVSTIGMAVVKTSVQDDQVIVTNVPIAEVIDTGATMKLGQISELLGFSVTSEILHSLGIEPVDKKRAAILYREADFPRICACLIANINAACVDFIEGQRKAA
jgi:hypothetical protein